MHDWRKPRHDPGNNHVQYCLQRCRTLNSALKLANGNRLRGAGLRSREKAGVSPVGTRSQNQEIMLRLALPTRASVRSDQGNRRSWLDQVASPSTSWG